MGSCITKRSKRNSFYGSIEDSQETTNASASSAHLFDYEFTQSGSGDNIKSDEFQHEIDKWLMEAENIFLNVVDIVNLPIELQRLIDVSNTEAGWLKIIQSMISVVGQRQFNGENDHIGPTIIILLLEDSPLPTRDQLKDLLKLLEPHFAARIHSPLDQNIIKQRNICTILSFLAEKFPGTNPLAVELLSMKVIKFLEKIIRENHNPLHILFALNCIEKFASSRENRDTILKNFNLIKELVELEKFAAQYTIGSLYCASPSDCLKYQIGFCAQWCLDNIILKKGRKLSYEKVDYSNLNAILNVKDKTEFIKLSSNGLSARCDTSTFECVRATFPVSTGCYYYEAIILTSGIMQIGWATKATNFRNDEGIGVGDDRNSIAFDGCRSVIWHNTTHYKHGLSRWNTGDVVGCLLDVENRKFIFYLNGKKVEINRKIAQKLNLHFSDQPYYAAASLMSYQQVYFNFGQAPFKYPPKKLKFTDFNSNAIVDNKDSIKIVPIHVQSRSISFSNRKNMCNICCDRVANVRLKPCNHETICSQCANQVDHLCPFCRNEFTHFEEIKS
ncbi:PREDICTED: RING finger and SPRY domain-containing protein 1-like [Rhagoletis zephyria]|uniref:RING finger and SPRY domain-containing protein 1-like n=1 Tax=Rhagoletis zephyria TaxID=28612 RepID=UPI000811A666|nr:PREDICTED: RING finger and SPRY domain-containing protein 1-like [Rhagoletis zephyria]KAH9394552.1 RING finger and SPRY domain-containing protein 1 [Tyrophagus putrescentiae]